MKFMRYALLALALLAPAAQAGQWKPSVAESDAFVKAYAYTVMRALMEEGLDLKVESGKVSLALAACLKQKMQLSALLVPLRPIVASSFSSRQSLRQATAFFRSPTGLKIKASGAQELRDMLRQHAGATPRLARDTPQLVATPADAAAADRFSRSQAGRDFQKFVGDGLPRLGAVDVFGTATEECAKQGGG
jgi:hypothetical protein